MKIKEFIKRYKIVLFLSFLVVVLIILKIKYGNLDNNKNQTVIPIPTVTPTITFDQQYPEETLEIPE